MPRCQSGNPRKTNMTTEKQLLEDVSPVWISWVCIVMLVLTLQMIIFWFVASKCRHLRSWFIIIAIHKFVGKGIARRANGALLHPYMHWFLKWSRSLEKSTVFWNTTGNPLFSKQKCIKSCLFQPAMFVCRSVSPKLDSFFPSSILTISIISSRNIGIFSKNAWLFHTRLKDVSWLVGHQEDLEHIRSIWG